MRLRSGFACLAVAALVLAAGCSKGNDGPGSGGQAGSTTSSSTTTSHGGSGAGGSGTGGAGAQGGNGSGGSGNGGTASGGSGQGGAATGGSGTGGAVACTHCSPFIDEFIAGNQPNKASLCFSSAALNTDVFLCLCGACYNDCSYTCSQNDSDTPNCSACFQGLVAGACAASYAACKADT